MPMCQFEGKQGAMAVEDSNLNSRGLYIEEVILFGAIHNEQRSCK